MDEIAGFNPRQLVLVLTTLFGLVVLVFILFDKIDESNVITMAFELAFAGLVAFLLAGYFLAKDRRLQKLDKATEKQALKEAFRSRLQKARAEIVQGIESAKKDELSRSDIRAMGALLKDADTAFKNYDITDIDTEKMLQNADVIIRKHDGAIMKKLVLLDLKSSLSLIERVCKTHHIDPD